MVAIDVLSPIGQPRYCLVVDDFLPFSRHVRFGNWDTFSNVENDVFRAYSFLSMQNSIRRNEGSGN